MKRLKSLSLIFFTKYNLVYNEKFINEDEDLREIENLNEIILVKKVNNDKKKLNLFIQLIPIKHLNK